jgi:hypothetical protein
LETPDVIPPTDKDGLYEVKVSPGWLIEELVIDIDDPEREYNPAIISKIVSKADMTVYPGASKSSEAFSFQAYTAQMSAYRAVITQLLEGVDATEQERRRNILKGLFSRQLVRMAEVDKRVNTDKPEERTAARKLANDVLKLYGLPHEEEPSSPLPYIIVENPYVECVPDRRCRLFGRFRR